MKDCDYVLSASHTGINSSDAFSPTISREKVNAASGNDHEHVDESDDPNEGESAVFFGVLRKNQINHSRSLQLLFEAPSAGIEPATKRLEGSCSIH